MVNEYAELDIGLSGTITSNALPMSIIVLHEETVRMHIHDRL